MKNLSLLILLLICGTKTFAQDTLVTINGSILPVYIIANDSSFISYKSLDTTLNEINMIQRNDVLFIKHQNGKGELFFIPDTVITMKGETILCKVMELGQETVTLFSYSKHMSEFQMVSSSELFIIRLSDGNNILIDHHAKQAVNSISEMDYFRMGESDAKKYFKTSNGALAGEVISGVGTYIYFLGAIPAAIIASRKPANLHSAVNPNDELLFSSHSYKEGYETAGLKKKKHDCWIAYGSGVLLPVAILAGVVMVYNRGRY